jgi:hypothetical protein
VSMAREGVSASVRLLSESPHACRLIAQALVNQSIARIARKEKGAEK